MKTLLIGLCILSAVTIAGMVFGYGIEAGSRLAPARLKLAAAIQASDEASDRLLVTLKKLVSSHCTWDTP